MAHVATSELRPSEAASRRHETVARRWAGYSPTPEEVRMARVEAVERARVERVQTTIRSFRFDS